MASRVSPALAAFLAFPEEERHLGPFWLAHPLGRGGFAPVWLGHERYGDSDLRTVAVKLFGVDVSPRVREAILEEARALCRVEHPNVVRFYAIAADASGAVLGLVMEHVQGRSLDARLEEQPRLEAREALAVGASIASALAAVHAVGLVHRDVKPANVVESSGVYKLIDFGIAAASELLGPQASEAQEPRVRKVVLDDVPVEMTVDATAVKSGFASGTLGYVDPVCVATGRAASAASDLYALGATLCECLCGAPPAVAAARAAGRSGVDEDILTGRTRPPSLGSLGALARDVPAPLVRLVDSLLEPDPAARPRSAEAVGWEIERIRRDLAGRSRPLPPEEVGPFRGLARFEADDRDVYFGRVTETAAALEVLRSHGLLALVGPSGSGKSSLARAGVLPAIADGALGGWPREWDTAILVPGTDPRAAIIEALAQWLPEGVAQAEPERLVGALVDRAHDKGRGVVLLVDQLEELATTAQSGEVAFARRVVECVGAQPLPGVRVVVTIRRDLLDPVLAMGDLGRVLARGMQLVMPMTDAIWVDVVDRALDAYGYSIEDEALRAELREELRRTSSAMPLVQFALAQLWDRRDRERKIVTRDALRAIGGLQGALEMHADATLARVAASVEGGEDTMRRMLLALTTPQGTRATRRPGEVLASLPPNAEAALAEVEHARLVVREPDGVTVAHDALLVAWGKLRTWIADARDDRLLAEELEREAAAYGEAASPDRLWRRRRLLAAEELLSRGGVEVSHAARAFVRAARSQARRGRFLVGAGATVFGAAVVTALYIANAASGQQDAVRGEAQRSCQAEIEKWNAQYTEANREMRDEQIQLADTQHKLQETVDQLEGCRGRNPFAPK
jgi:serine/threonine protein kinase